VENLRSELSKSALIRPVAVKDDSGNVDHWNVIRTAAPR
jgi:hypothetical protein